MVQIISASSSHASDSGSRCRKRLMRRGLDGIGMTFHKVRPVEGRVSRWTEGYQAILWR